MLVIDNVGLGTESYEVNTVSSMNSCSAYINSTVKWRKNMPC